MKKDAVTFTAETLRETVMSFQKSRIILTAVELRIFSLLDMSCMTARQTASRLGADIRAIDRLMNALVVIGLLTKSNNLFSNSAFSSQYLVESSPDYMLGLGHSANMWHSWSNLTEVVRKGKSFTEKKIGKRGSDWLKAFIAAMHYRAKTSADEAVSNLNLNNVTKVLDVGGGSGDFAMAFVRKKKSIIATVFDLPEVIPLTKKYIAEAGMTNNIDTYEGDYTSDKLPGGYDLIFLSAVVHSNSPDINRRLIKKCANALNPKGQIVIQDFIMNDNRTLPAAGALFAINMLVGTEAGDTFTENEIKAWFKNACLKFVKILPAPMGNSQMIAEKL